LHVHVSRASCSWFKVFYDVVKRLNGVVGHLVIEGGVAGWGFWNVKVDWGMVCQGYWCGVC
jgi:hypothetical protein